MTIVFDLRALFSPVLSGIQSYTFNLLKNLLRIDQKNKYILLSSGLKKTKNSYLNEFLKFANTELMDIALPNKILNFSLAFLQYPKLDKIIKKADLFFFPNLMFNALSFNKPYIIVFHDLSFEVDPSFFSLKMRAWHKIIQPKKIAQNAKKIIAVSKNTKRDLIKFYGIKKNKIQLAYPGIVKSSKVAKNSNNSQWQKIRQKYNLPKNFILYLGTLEPRKNITSIIQAFEIFKQEKLINSLNEHLNLVIAGQCGWQCKKIYQTVEKNQFAKDIIFTGFIEEKDKPYLYYYAKTFIYPSLYEGFGFPPLEALSYGTPVIVSYNSSLPETAGKYAILVDPYNAREIAEGIKTALSLPKTAHFHPNLILKKYNWEKCAKKILKTIEEYKK